MRNSFVPKDYSLDWNPIASCRASLSTSTAYGAVDGHVQTSYRSEQNANEEESRQDCFRRQDGLPGFQSLLLESRAVCKHCAQLHSPRNSRRKRAHFPGLRINLAPKLSPSCPSGSGSEAAFFFLLNSPMDLRYLESKGIRDCLVRVTVCRKQARSQAADA